MSGFGHGDLILHDRIGFGVEIAAVLSLLNHDVAVADARQIFIGAAQRRVIGGNAFQRVTGFQQIEL
ncbi:hypothetical protein AK51_24250 [Serratia nematodiphila DZ0503SBS1]|nr:hypothetical protein AK51_24250 [Serratia nematodiphila DZ0503SBS1]